MESTPLLPPTRKAQIVFHVFFTIVISLILWLDYYPIYGEKLFLSTSAKTELGNMTGIKEIYIVSIKPEKDSITIIYKKDDNKYAVDSFRTKNDKFIEKIHLQNYRDIIRMVVIHIVAILPLSFIFLHSFFLGSFKNEFNALKFIFGLFIVGITGCGIATLIDISTGWNLLNNYTVVDGGRLLRAFPETVWISILMIFSYQLFVEKSFLNKIRLEKNSETITQLKLDNKALIRDNIELIDDVSKADWLLQPHFIANIFNNLSSYINSKKLDYANEYILNVSNIVQYLMGEGQKKQISLLTDVEMIESYIKVRNMPYEDVKYEDKIQKNISDKYKIYPLLLMDFVENAYKHGVVKTTKDKYLSVELYVDNGNKLFFHIVNSQSEKYPGALDKAQLDTNKHSKLGIAHAMTLLKKHYAGKHELEIKTIKNQFSVKLTIQLEVVQRN